MFSVFIILDVTEVYFMKPFLVNILIIIYPTYKAG